MPAHRRKLQRCLPAPVQSVHDRAIAKQEAHHLGLLANDREVERPIELLHVKTAAAAAAGSGGKICKTPRMLSTEEQAFCVYREGLTALA